MISERDSKIDELKILVSVMPHLKKQMDNSYLRLLEERNSNCGKEENGFIYHVRPTIQSNYDIALKMFNENGQRRIDLIRELGLTCNMDGVPDFEESNLKPYGWDRIEIRDFNNCNSPIGLP